ncbi:MAG TPA: AlkA N-terminal domain-containing protein [Ktedonobacterales bacterium]
METHPLIADFDRCYRAMTSHDARFDGRFFVAVTTTGIYCRPICPAPMPHASHVRFYLCAAAAEAAGFRACRRCHPEASPGSAEWNARADLVARALRLIADGVADTEGVAGLAQRLSVSVRHLHRELTAEVGVGPLALARTRRAQAARVLIAQTDLPLATIAFTAGFASIRQFNQTMQAAFDCPPSAFRRQPQTEARGEGKLSLRLSYRPPLDIALLLAYFQRRALLGVEEVSETSYRRTVRLPASRGIVELEPAKKGHAILMQVRLDTLRDLNVLVQRCRHLFDLDAAPMAVVNVLGADSMLAPLVATHPGLRVPGAIDGFEIAVRAILGQQVSVAGARTLVGRLVMAFGEPIEQPQGALTHYFPTPLAIAQANLEGYGLTRSRITALQALARSIVERRLVLDRSADWEEAQARLQEIPGIGPWTAAYISMRALGNPDAFPATDLGLRQAFEQQGAAADARLIERRAESWRPWRAYAAQYLWASLPVTQPLRQRLPQRQRGRVAHVARAASYS